MAYCQEASVDVIKRVNFDTIYKIDPTKKELGRGMFGIVRRCKHIDTGKEYAAKEFLIKYKHEEDKFKDEAEICSSLEHPHIVQLHNAIIQEGAAGRKGFLVLELITGGELFDFIVEQHTLSEKVASSFIQQILGVL